MSLLHISDRLHTLSERRYTHGYKDIPKVLRNYFNFLTFTGLGRTSFLNAYVRRRVYTFSQYLPDNWIMRPMPGEAARNQFWADPRVEFAMQNRRI